MFAAELWSFVRCFSSSSTLITKNLKPRGRRSTHGRTADIDAPTHFFSVSLKHTPCRQTVWTSHRHVRLRGHGSAHLFKLKSDRLWTWWSSRQQLSHALLLYVSLKIWLTLGLSLSQPISRRSELNRSPAAPELQQSLVDLLNRKHEASPSARSAAAQHADHFYVMLYFSGNLNKATLIKDSKKEVNKNLQRRQKVVTH